MLHPSPLLRSNESQDVIAQSTPQHVNKNPDGDPLVTVSSVHACKHFEEPKSIDR